MLVLDRKVGEVIVIRPGEPDEVRITVMEVHSEKVRLGVAAPPEVPVHRIEVARRIARGEARRGGVRRWAT